MKYKTIVNTLYIRIDYFQFRTENFVCFILSLLNLIKKKIQIKINLQYQESVTCCGVKGVTTQLLCPGFESGMKRKVQEVSTSAGSLQQPSI